MVPSDLPIILYRIRADGEVKSDLMQGGDGDRDKMPWMLHWPL